MAFEQFKTQVLLLHSQQSTLDALGASFNDRYSVHYATSGSEALTTLGETPIHIIVSAQNLPGMSGLEALREAKRRSPETIGILLAGNETDDDVEALVGDREVFQVVRGAISCESLLEIVDRATKRIRLLALAESANDTSMHAADSFREAAESGQHIIMETAENGASIISDSTDRLPALKPEPIESVPNTGSRLVDVLVLTKDAEFLTTIKDASRGLHSVHHAQSMKQAQKALRTHKIGVVVTDAAVAGSRVEQLTRKLRGAAPRLIAIVAGRRDDGDMLMDLINRGQVYRFLLKPVSPGRARLAIEASVRRHLETPAAGGEAEAKKATRAPAARSAQSVTRATARGATRSLNAAAADMAATHGKGIATTRTATARPGRAALPRGPRASSIRAAAAALLLAGVAWHLLQDAGEPASPQPGALSPATPSVTESDTPRRPGASAAPAATPAKPPAPHAALLDDARSARAGGRLIAPAGDNAVELYVAARDVAPDNAVIAAELKALIGRLLGMAEDALLEDRGRDADAILEKVEFADPGNARLPFLKAQRHRMQLRTTLADARLAIREARFEDAARQLTRATAIPGADANELRALREDIDAARSAQRVDDVLARANRRLAQGRLTTPSNDNARYFFELALDNDPGNAAATQGLIAVASKLVLQARAAIDSGELAAARRLLDDAGALDPDSAELSATANALEAAQARRAEAERRAAVARAEAERRAAAERAAAAREAQAVAEQRRRDAASATPETAPEQDGGGTATTGGTPETAAPSSGGDRAPVAGNDGPPDFVAVSSLTRINYVAPKYPRNARRRDITGWVDVVFAITEQGTVGEIEVLESSPGAVFDNAATEAVAQWRFEPVVVDGVAVPKRAAVRMSFDLQ